MYIHRLYILYSNNVVVLADSHRTTYCTYWYLQGFKVSEKNNKKKKKNSQMIIRINDEERAQFIALCEDLDTSAAREVRHFIREFIAKHGDQ